MKSVTTSLQVFGLYLILIPGIGLMAFPGFILDLFQLSHGGVLWPVRMIGLLASIIGVFDICMAHYRLQPLYRHSEWLRYFAALFMTGLWAAGQVQIAILLFAAIDAAGATWTWVVMGAEPDV